MYILFTLIDVQVLCLIRLIFICCLIITNIFDTWLTGWCLSTTMELMGGTTPMTCRLPGLRTALASSERPVIRAVTVFEAFCWPAVTVRTLVCGNCHYKTTTMIVQQLDWSHEDIFDDDLFLPVEGNLLQVLKQGSLLQWRAVCLSGCLLY